MDLSPLIPLLSILASSTIAEGNLVTKVTDVGNDTTLEAIATIPHVLMYSLPW